MIGYCGGSTLLGPGKTTISSVISVIFSIQGECLCVSFEQLELRWAGRPCSQAVEQRAAPVKIRFQKTTNSAIETR